MKSSITLHIPVYTCEEFISKLEKLAKPRELMELPALSLDGHEQFVNSFKEFWDEAWGVLETTEFPCYFYITTRCEYDILIHANEVALISRKVRELTENNQ